MSTVFNKEKIESQDNVAILKNYIKEYEMNFDETVSDIEEEESVETKDVIKEKKPKDIKKNWKIVLSSGIDTIIERKTRNSVIQLILMPTQDKYLLMSDNVIQDITTMTADDFKAFFRNLKKDDEIKINNVVFQTIKKEDAEFIYDMIINYRSLLQKGMMSYPFYKKMHGLRTYSYYKHTIQEIYRNLVKEEKLFKMLCTKTAILEGNNKYDEDFIEFMLTINETSGYDAARYFAEIYTRSSVEGINLNNYRYYGYRNSTNAYREIFSSKFNLNIKRLSEYLCFDLYGQGFSRIPISLYKDYLDMAYAFDDKKIKEKYPKHLMTDHDILAQDVSQSEEIKAIVEANSRRESDKLAQEETEKRAKAAYENFIQNYDKFKKILDISSNIVFEYKDVVLKIPDDPKELIREGTNLGHCVASYIPRVASDECLILFARNKDAMETSYLTVEIRPSGISSYKGAIYSIAQIQGDCKRTALTKEEITFFKKFMEKYNILATNSNLK